MNYKITQQVNFEEIESFLTNIDSSFTPPLSSRVNLKEYTFKLKRNGHFLSIKKENKIVSLIVFYLNEMKTKAYVPIIGTLKEYRGQGFTSMLLTEMDKQLYASKIKEVRMETWLNGQALLLYLKNGYFVDKIVDDRGSVDKSVKLFKKYDVQDCHFSFKPTPLEQNSNLNQSLKRNIFIKRDDIFPVTGGGSKGRKLKYILKKAVDNGCTAVVTAGSCHSNHLRAAAVMCAELGLKLIACIHDEKPKIYKGNLKILSLYASEMIFCKMENIKTVMNNAMIELIHNNEKPFYIYGGGHCHEGTLAYVEAVKELENQIKVKPDYIFVASGTGGTQAGIEIGVKKYFPECKVIGISVGRNEERGKRIIQETINEYVKIKNEDIVIENIIFHDKYLMGGYSNYNDHYLSFLKESMKKYGLVLDPIYSGKAFYAMHEYITDNKIQPNETVVFWNTGGLLNLLN